MGRLGMPLVGMWSFLGQDDGARLVVLCMEAGNDVRGRQIAVVTTLQEQVLARLMLATLGIASNLGHYNL
jgi:hypothetical protein